jgi:serine O-acetyltransferase
VTVFQHVTLGKISNESLGFPIVESEAIIYAGAVILGPVRIGKGARVAANAVVRSNVPSGASFGGVPAKSLAKPK